MKKIILGFAALVALTVGLSACGAKKDSSLEVLKVGASPTPHAEILEHIKPLMKKEGVDLQIKTFNDYVMPNKALASGEIDANFFQHVPYMENQMKENPKYDFVSAGAVHIELMAFYSKTIKSVKDIKDGTTIIFSNSEAEWGRSLTILKDAGLITLKDGVTPTTATFDDVTSNPKNLVFKHDIDPAMLVTTYNNETKALVAINANYAYDAKLNPTKDAVMVEKDNSPYANIITVNAKDKNDKNIKKLMKVLHSDAVQKWITDEWKGSVKAVTK